MMRYVYTISHISFKVSIHIEVLAGSKSKVWSASDDLANFGQNYRIISFGFENFFYSITMIFLLLI